ncbi:Outer membrane protein transport protein [Sulfidibacter corallicola]|uniref:Outer membrane protein transport protein n=1 Tax=Sulfidibacter corallicola TaxID=2818388 RepID=A0A8A4TY30_SULCO|nr:outer membrane protein transport protein [Sulfidibacter corallicola]QTD53994.1 outer membrane protein transport protein [Sulfidibacter corallicola]
MRLVCIRVSAWLCVFWLLAGPIYVSAHGYQVDEQSARRLGDSFSGGAAEARDASTAYYNPAGLIRLKQTEYVTGISLINTQTDFEGGAVTTDGLAVLPVQGNDGGDPDSNIVIPHLYVARPLTENTVFGFSLNVPYATGTDYDRDFVGRYFATESELFGVHINTSVGVAVTERFSMGIGLSLQYLDGSLGNDVNSAGICALAEASGALAALGLPSCAQQGFDTPGTSTDDGSVLVEGDDVGFGVTFGLLYQFNEGSRVGFNYRSDIEHNLDGEAEFRFPAHTQLVLPLADPNLRDRTVDGLLELVTPEALSLSGFHQVNGNWSIQGDVTWTRWSRFQTLTIEPQDGPHIVQPQLWDDTLRFALGTEVRVSEAMSLRAGAARDESPIPDETLNLNFPFEDYRAFSVGMTYRFSDTLAMDVGLQHTLGMEVDITQGTFESDAAILTGTVETDITSFAIGFNLRR